MGGQVDLAKGAFANQATKGIVADGLEIGAREFAAESGTSVQESPQRRKSGDGDGGETHSKSSW